jgi:hypothetical protein
MQTQEAIYSGSPVVNPGYFDIPICNEFSNKPEKRTINFDTNFDLNKNIRKTINNNKEEYLINQTPTLPSASLYYETDNSLSSYYNPNYVNRYYNVVENFANEDNNEKDKQKFFFVLLLIVFLLFVMFCCRK